LLCQATPPTALICNNDFIAAAAIAECRALEISVPGKVSVTGFGDWDLARLGSPSLTTVRSDAVRIGHLSARNLLKQINADGECMAEQDEFEAELIVRESTSNPSAA
jgi:LacI family transcriptional regulator